MKHRPFRKRPRQFRWWRNRKRTEMAAADKQWAADKLCNVGFYPYPGFQP